MSISFIKTDDAIVVTLPDGEQGTVYNGNPKYEQLRAALAAGDVELCRELIRPAVHVEREVERVRETGTHVHIEDGVVYFDGEAIHSTLTDRMIELLGDGFPITPLILFLENLMENPSYRAVEELYGFLEHGNMPITEDGHFLAYKIVRHDFKDCYSGTFDNSPGSVCEMPRNRVDEDKHNTCSHGLHFCAREYLSFYGDGSSGSRAAIMIKINPRDVVAIPTDYNNTKGRCCRYEVVAAIDAVQTHIEGPVRTDSQIVQDDTSGHQLKNISGAVAQFDEDGDLVDVFESARLAQDDTGIDSSSIRKVCRGERRRAGGYAWAWVDALDVEIRPIAIRTLSEKQGPSFENPQIPSADSMRMGFDPDDMLDEDDEDWWRDDIPY